MDSPEPQIIMSPEVYKFWRLLSNATTPAAFSQETLQKIRDFCAGKTPVQSQLEDFVREVRKAAKA